MDWQKQWKWISRIPGDAAAAQKINFSHPTGDLFSLVLKLVLNKIKYIYEKWLGKGRQVDTFGARGNPEEGATPTHCHNSWIHPEIFPKVQTSQPIRTSPEWNSPSLSINCQPPWPSTWIFPHSHPQPAHKHINPKTNTIQGLSSEAESRELVALWDDHLILTLTKTKEMTVTCYHMDDRLDWRFSREGVYKKWQSRLVHLFWLENQAS